MGVLGLIKAVLSLANVLMKYASDKQLMDAGAAKSALKGLKQANAAIDKARLARESVKHDPDSMRDDPDNRRNHPE